MNENASSVAELKRIAVILDDGKIARWQSDALAETQGLVEVCLVLNCQNSLKKRAVLKNFAYYLLNFFTIRNRYSRSYQYNAACPVLNFEAIYQGNWQLLPDDALRALSTHKVNYIVKFGMGLLHIGDELTNFPVLSYHHGDPDHFRGRPAGYYEIQQDKDVVGLIVQRISNTLDGGMILAKNFSKISRHSYRKTIEQLYCSSRYTLRQGLRTLMTGSYVPAKSVGKNYRLPTNLAVLRFVVKLAKEKFAHLTYGLFREKQWKVAEVNVEGGICNLEALGKALADEHSCPPPFDIPSGYSFLADPFYHPSANIMFAEGLNARTGIGAILAFDRNTRNGHTVLEMAGHLSYPFTLQHGGQSYLLPELAGQRSPVLFEAENPHRHPIPILGLEGERLLDATHYTDGNHHYIFASRKGEPDCLQLFVGDAIAGPYHLHPCSPVLTDPRGARMGGRILQLGQNLVRFGQNNCRAYGQAIIAFSIEKISPYEYSESERVHFAFKNANGPHTLDFKDDWVVFDYYQERFSFSAGYRRVAAKLTVLLRRRIPRSKGKQ